MKTNPIIIALAILTGYLVIAKPNENHTFHFDTVEEQSIHSNQLNQQPHPQKQHQHQQRNERFEKEFESQEKIQREFILNFFKIIQTIVERVKTISYTFKE